MAKSFSNIFPRLREKMAEKNDTVKDLCRILEMSANSLRRSLKGEQDFRLAELDILADSYECSIDDLFITDIHISVSA